MVQAAGGAQRDEHQNALKWGRNFRIRGAWFSGREYPEVRESPRLDAAGAIFGEIHPASCTAETFQRGNKAEKQPSREALNP